MRTAINIFGSQTFTASERKMIVQVVRQISEKDWFPVSTDTIAILYEIVSLVALSLAGTGIEAVSEISETAVRKRLSREIEAFTRLKTKVLS